MEYHYCLGEQIKKAELVNYQLFTTKPMEKHGRSGVILTKSNTELFKDQHTHKLWTPLQHGNQTTHTHTHGQYQRGFKTRKHPWITQTWTPQKRPQLSVHIPFQSNLRGVCKKKLRKTHVGRLKYAIIPANDSLTESRNNYTSLNEAFGDVTVTFYLFVCVIAKGKKSLSKNDSLCDSW